MSFYRRDWKAGGEIGGGSFEGDGTGETSRGGFHEGFVSSEEEGGTVGGGGGDAGDCYALKAVTGAYKAWVAVGDGLVYEKDVVLECKIIKEEEMNPFLSVLRYLSTLSW